MKKLIIITAIVIAAAVVAILNVPKGRLGSDSSNSVTSITEASLFNQVGLTASRSQQGMLSQAQSRVYSVEVTSDATSLRYLQLFDLTQASVPARAASKSSTYSLKIYKASQSWASAVNIAAKPLGSYQQYASPSLIESIPIPPATASNSPTVIRIDSSQFAPGILFRNGIMFGISTTYGSYASPSAVSQPAARHTIKILYK